MKVSSLNLGRLSQVEEWSKRLQGPAHRVQLVPVGQLDSNGRQIRLVGHRRREMIADQTVARLPNSDQATSRAAEPMRLRARLRVNHNGVLVGRGTKLSGRFEAFDRLGELPGGAGLGHVVDVAHRGLDVCMTHVRLNVTERPHLHRQRAEGVNLPFAGDGVAEICAAPTAATCDGRVKWGRLDSNQRASDYESGALTN